ncbi:hypothetical protein B296_00027726 [Ensete ventricosum]|uniref:Uncharacterized protein n=1 Tax=Ensete ventricosum TaxID=4639 RepID=A0A426ZGB9_ENSVE|nr:hypothetical protein B296_00027726 [Ensete ventricosum]
MTVKFGDDLQAIVGITLDGYGGLVDGCGRAPRHKNAVLIPSVRTLIDSKLGGDHYRGSASLKLYRGFLLQIDAQRL